MEIQVNTRPNLFLEVADLVCAYVNGIEPKYLTEDGGIYIPAAEVAKMMEEVCGDLVPSSGRLKFYFRGYKLDEINSEERQQVCIGGLLLGTGQKLENCDLQTVRQALHDSYLGTGKPYRINSLGGRGLGWDTCEEYCALSDELDKLSMPEGLRLRLVETLSAYHRHVDQLCDLLEPLAERLWPLLEPWVEKAQPQIEQWRLALNTPERLNDFLSRFNVKLDDVKKIIMCPRMFYPSVCSGSYSRLGVLFCNAGIGLQIGEPGRPVLQPNEVAALRLLGGADRIEMLRALVGQSMGPREISRKLEINPGTVFRDLNSMCQTHLLKITPEGKGYTYTTNLDYLKQVVTRLVEYIESGQ